MAGVFPVSPHTHMAAHRYASGQKCSIGMLGEGIFHGRSNPNTFFSVGEPFHIFRGGFKVHHKFILFFIDIQNLAGKEFLRGKRMGKNQTA
ncbi:hypothetical protein JCM12294_14380 [Desulfocicer niacini]